MKKTVLILLAVMVMLFAVTVVTASAEESKTDYYDQIADLVARISAALKAGNQKEAEDLLELLRALIYRCGRYLVSIGEYDSRILQVLDIAQKAVEAGGAEAEGESFEDSVALAAEVLLDTEKPTPVVPEGLHS